MFTFSKEDLMETPSKKQSLTGKNLLGGGKKGILAISVIALVLLAGIWVNNMHSIVYGVSINGEQVLIYDNKEEATQAVPKFLETKSQEVGRKVTTKDQIEVQEIRVAREDSDIVTGDNPRLLEAQLHMMIPGVALMVNGEEKAVLPDRETADSLINRVKDYYTPTKKDFNVVKVELKENVEILEKDVPLNKLMDGEQAFQLLTLGTEKMVTHTVCEGESLWSIAKDNQMCMEDLEAANPDYNPDKLQIGDEIKLAKLDPVVHVTTVAEFSEVKKVPCKTIVENDSNMLRGQEKIKEAGQDGTKEFKYLLVAENGRQVDKQFVSGTVLTKPVDKVVVKGSKMVLASRSGSSGKVDNGGGKGALRWPITGQITSRYGYRGKEFHTGLDINGNTGDPVRAAEAGKVISATRSGGYGNIIKIDHGGGVQTWYAHLSAFNVKAGSQVSRGDLIGRVGNTGRSTGAHLHLEVRVNGSPQNPLNYLN